MGLAFRSEKYIATLRHPITDVCNNKFLGWIGVLCWDVRQGCDINVSR